MGGVKGEGGPQRGVEVAGGNETPKRGIWEGLSPKRGGGGEGRGSCPKMRPRGGS